MVIAFPCSVDLNLDTNDSESTIDNGEFLLVVSSGFAPVGQEPFDECVGPWRRRTAGLRARLVRDLMQIVYLPVRTFSDRRIDLDLLRLHAFSLQ
jgi:hypothetical protein